MASFGLIGSPFRDINSTYITSSNLSTNSPNTRYDHNTNNLDVINSYQTELKNYNTKFFIDNTDNLLETELDFITNVLLINNKIAIFSEKIQVNIILIEKEQEIVKNIDNFISSLKLVSFVQLGIIVTMEHNNREDELLEYKYKLNQIKSEKLNQIQKLIFDNCQLLLKKNFLKKMVKLTKIDVDSENINDIDCGSITCTICDANNIKYCINPCGHTFCEGCSSKLSKTCHICRGNITDKIKMFLG